MPDPKVEIVGIRELRLGEVLTMSYPGQPVLGTKQVVPMFLETMDPKTGEKVELKLALSMEQLAELQARAAKASTGTEYIGRLQFFGPLRVGDSGLSTNIYKPPQQGQLSTPFHKYDDVCWERDGDQIEARRRVDAETSARRSNKEMGPSRPNPLGE